MDDYRQNLHAKYPNLSGLKITIRPMAREVLPWTEWNQNQNPDWWRKHQLVKHQRDQYFPDANLKNVLYAAAGLLVFLTYWHQPELYKGTREIRVILYAKEPSFRTYYVLCPREK